MLKPQECLAFALFLPSATAAWAQGDVLTANYDNNRTNATVNEVLLTTNNVNPTQFGKIFSFPVDGQVYAQPLYVHALSVFGRGTLNVLYVATMHNSVYAFDADAATGTSPLWQVNLGASIDPLSFSVAGDAPFHDIQHELGILSTPAIDRTTNTIYVVNETTAGGNMAFFVHALDLLTGAEKLGGPVQIQASVAGTGWAGTSDASNGELPLLASGHLQRTGLLLANGSVYIGFGSHGDYVPWHGWIVAYNAGDLQQQTAVFNTTPSTAGSSIWQGGRGLAADPNGEIYCSTGNGNYDGVVSWGESVLHLTATLDVADWFTPAKYATWTDEDLDFGSNGPLLIPGTNLLVAGGKAGVVALIDRTNMGHELDGDAGVLQTFQAVPSGQFAIFNSALYDLPAGPILYIWGFNDPLRSFQIQSGAFTPLSINSTTLNALPFSGMTVSSNGAVPGTGILWATTISSVTSPAPGALHAYSAVDISQELWNSDMQSARDAMGNFTKFANPTVANGKVYVPTDSSQVVVYGFLQVPGIEAVVNAASFTTSAVAPGEIVSIFGLDIGPNDPVGAVIDAQGKLATSLRGYSVTFDGLPAPLLFASQGQINAIVPFETARQSSTLMVVNTLAGPAFHVTLPVSDSAPGVFALGASGQGAILNGDSSVNTPDHSAARGSYISIYATGTGVLTPAVADGVIVRSIPGANLPVSAAPVSVTIGGQPATVTYQGAAPGFVAGAIQINALVPSNITPGPAVPVAISVAGTPSLNTVTVAVN